VSRTAVLNMFERPMQGKKRKAGVAFEEDVLFRTEQDKTLFERIRLSRPRPPLLEGRRKEIQAHLVSHNIALSPKIFAPLERPNHVRQEGIEKFLGGLDEQFRQVESTLLDRMDFITFSQLESALCSCVQRLNVLLEGKPFSIGYTPGKSQQWVVELALGYLDHLPVESFRVETGGGSWQIQICSGENFVVFDDASYSGTQLYESLAHLAYSVHKGTLRDDFSLFFVVPFLSKTAEKVFFTQLAAIRKAIHLENMNVHLITSGVGITSFDEVYKKGSSEREELFACEKKLYERKVLKSPPELVYESGFGKCLTFTEWKRPDSVSVPEHLRQFFTDERPVYWPKERVL